MRRYFLLLPVLATSFLCPPAFAKLSTNETAILKIEHEMAEAQTAASVTEAWDKDAVWDDMLPGQVVGLASIQADLEKQFSAVTNVRTTILRIEIEADDHLGFAFSSQHLIADGKNGGPGIVMTFRATDCFHKENGKWLLVYQHISVPFDPKSGKAVFNVK